MMGPAVAVGATELRQLQRHLEEYRAVEWQLGGHRQALGRGTSGKVARKGRDGLGAMLKVK